MFARGNRKILNSSDESVATDSDQLEKKFGSGWQDIPRVVNMVKRLQKFSGYSTSDGSGWKFEIRFANVVERPEYYPDDYAEITPGTNIEFPEVLGLYRNMLRRCKPYTIKL